MLGIEAREGSSGGGKGSRRGVGGNRGYLKKRLGQIRIKVYALHGKCWFISCILIFPTFWIILYSMIGNEALTNLLLIFSWGNIC